MPGSKNILRVRDLTFSYSGQGEPIIRGLNLNIDQGEIFGLLGPSGCGKSTTQKILMGLLTGYQGDITIMGQSLSDWGQDYYERIGVGFELPTLYLRMTARENLQFFANLYTSKCMDPVDALTLVDLQDAADQSVDSFSKGMKMRLNLCRAIIHDPEFLFLDEPTSGQDPARARITRDLILSLRERGKTVFLTTHNMAEAADICDRVGFLDNGHIPVVGKPADLMRQYGSESVEVTSDSPSGRVKTEYPAENLAQNSAFLADISDGFISIHSKEARLEDVFVAVTGGKK